MDLDDAAELFGGLGFTICVVILVVDAICALTGHPAPIWFGNPLPGWVKELTG